MNDEAISVAGLSKRFAGQVVVHGIDLHVKTGEIFAFVGSNGSGKTTTIRMLCGLLTPDAGEGHCLGFDVRHQYSEIKQHVGYMSQGFSLYADLTVRENLRFSVRIHRLSQANRRVFEALNTFHLKPYAERLAGALSGGMQQRLSLACALIHDPKLLLLDEPTGGVDPESRRSFWHIIRQKAAQGVSVLVSTHYLDEVELYADRLTYIHSGSILVTGTLKEVIEQTALIAFRLPVLPAATVDALGQEEAVSTAEMIVGSVMVTGPDSAALEAVLSRFGLLTQAQQVPPGLEDLFFYLARHRHSDG